MLDVKGLSLTELERQQLASPLVGGLILFARNFADIEQLSTLIKEIRTAANQALIIAVDHEGGRVQRFKQGFTHLPAMGNIISYCNNDIAKAQNVATELGWLMASELLAADIDISFAPVLDLDICSKVIGDRAFSDQSDIVIALGKSFIDGMGQAGMASTGKHFPGHGSVVADSHVAIPVDERSGDDISALDQKVFNQLIGGNKIDALMPAHVIYPALCDKPAGFSPFWLQTILRQKLAFDGVIFSDDLGMEGASVAGDFGQRTKAALSAGCDMVLVCNNSAGATEALTYLEGHYHHIKSENEIAQSQRRLRVMLHKGVPSEDLKQSTRWKDAVRLVSQMSSNNKA